MARIMIIDDDEEFAKHTASVLASRGHQTKLIHTTEHAVATLMAEKPDLLVLDVMFPDNPVAGFDLARQVRQHREIKDLPILLLTGVNQEFPMGFSADDIDSDWMPVQNFIEKPFKNDDLLRKAGKLLAGARKK
jgi:CheY-like chemotaxis protein